MKDISDKVIKRIKEDEVQPYSKWRFILHRFVIIILFAVSVLLGSLASGVTIFQLTHAEWDLYQHFNHSILQFVFLVIPYFWLVFICGFTVVAIYFFRHTERGYRYSAVGLVFVSIVVSVAGGFIFYKAGFSEKLEIVFQDKVPFYRAWQECKMRFCMAPEHGFLAGKIIEVLPGNRIKVLDLSGNRWMVATNGAFWRGRLKPVKGLKIKIIGRMRGKGWFEAKEIRPWRGWKCSPNAATRCCPGQCGNRGLRGLSEKNK